MQKLTKQVEELHYRLSLPINNPLVLQDNFKLNMFLNSLRNEFEDVAVEIQGFTASNSEESRAAISNSIGRLIWAATSLGVAIAVDLPKELEEIHKQNLQKADRLKSEGFF